MALFDGDDLVTVTTPDGRTLQLPRGAVPSSLWPQPQIAPTPGAAPFAPPTQSPVEAAPPTLPSPESTPAPAVVVEEGEPEVTPVVQMEPEVVSADPKRVAKARAVQAAQAASPQAQMANATAQQQSTIVAEGEAVLKAADVEAATQDVLATALDQRNRELDKLFAKRAEDADAALAAETAKMDEISAMRKRIASTKIDRKADHPILAALGIALAGLGSAMKGESTNPGLEMFWRAIDRKVAAQEADLDGMAKTYGLSKDELETLRTKSQRQLEFHNMLIAGETEKAIRHVEEITARTASEKTKAHAQLLIAQLKQRAADKSMEALRWGLDYDQKDRAEKNQNTRFAMQLRQADRHHADNVQLKREDMYLDYQKALAAERAKGNELAYKAKLEMIKDNESRGIRHTITGDALLTPEGRKMVATATKLEEEAKALREFDAKSPDPNARANAETRARMLEEKASVMRGEAQISHMVRHRDPTQAGKFSDIYSTTQNMTTAVDEIKEMYDRDGRSYIYTSVGQADVKSKLVGVLMDLKNAWQLGVLSKQDTQLIQAAMGEKDPIDGWTPGSIAAVLDLKFGQDPEGFKAALDAIVSKAQNKVFLDAKQTNFSGTKEDLFYHRRPVEASPEGKALEAFAKDKTPSERVAEAEASGAGVKGAITTGVQKVFYGTSPAAQAQQHAESGSVKHLGLFSPEQGRSFDTLLQSYKSGKTRSGDLLVAQVLNNATSRPELALATIKNLREHAPDLYAKAREGIKAGPVAEALEYEEKNRIGVAQIPTTTLVQQGRMVGWGDEEIKAELVRRATYDKDKEAGSALLEIVQTKRRSDLPRGSVFREGR